MSGIWLKCRYSIQLDVGSKLMLCLLKTLLRTCLRLEREEQGVNEWMQTDT